MTRGSFDTDVAARRVLANNRQAESSFESFKQEHGLPVDALIVDTACQRKLKIGDGANRKFFSPYHGLTLAVFPPTALKLLVSKSVASLGKQLAAAGLEHAFLFLPADSYHVTLTGIVERIEPAVDSHEICHYSRLVEMAGRGLPADAPPPRISIGKMQLSGQFVILFEVAFDRIPERTLAALTSQIGRQHLLTGGFHLTVCYLTRDLTPEEQSSVNRMLEGASSLLAEHDASFTSRDAALYVFDSMESYREVEGVRIHLV